MKRSIIISALFLFSCHPAFQTENGFGNMKIGMSISEYNKLYPKSEISYVNGKHYYYESLELSKNIIAKQLYVYFINDTIASLVMNYNAELFDLLKKQNDIEYMQKEVAIFHSKNKNIQISCSTFGDKKTISIYSKEILNQVK